MVRVRFAMDFFDEASVRYTVGGCPLTLKLTDLTGHASTRVYWGVDDHAWEYRRISEIGKEIAQFARPAIIYSNAFEVLDPFGNVFGLAGVGGKDERTARQRRTAQKLALQNVRETLDQIQQKDHEQKKINRIVAWVVTFAVVLALVFAWAFASRQTRHADVLPKLPIKAIGQ